MNEINSVDASRCRDAWVAPPLPNGTAPKGRATCSRRGTSRPRDEGDPAAGYERLELVRADVESAVNRACHAREVLHVFASDVVVRQHCRIEEGPRIDGL